MPSPSKPGRKQSIIQLTKDIRSLKDRGCVPEAITFEQEAIEGILQSLWQAVIHGTGRVEVIEILNTSIDFCATLLADEKECIHTSGTADLDVHAAAHKDLLTKLVAARRSASGEGLSLAVLDATELLYDFQEDLKTHNQLYAVKPSMCMASGA